MEAVDLVVTEFIALAIICVILLQYYAGPMVRLDVLVSVYLSWVVGLSGLLLLPYDISVAINDNMQSQVLDSVWKFVYWRLASRDLTQSSIILLFHFYF